MQQAERMLQREVVTRLRHAPLSAVVVPSPNGIWIPARTPAERELARRVVYQLKQDGQILPGAPDLLVLWDDGCGCLELKRPPTQTLLEKKRRGQASPEQRAFAATCAEHGIRYQICETWPEVRDTLIDWGRLPPGWREADARIGRAV